MDQSFAQRIYELVAAIPPGAAATYGQLAFLAGSPRAARIVGCLMARVPEEKALPCHRVVFRDGSLCKGDSFGGEEIQRQILRQEGVFFLPDGRVDLTRSGWKGARLSEPR